MCAMHRCRVARTNAHSTATTIELQISACVLFIFRSPLQRNGKNDVRLLDYTECTMAGVFYVFPWLSCQNMSILVHSPGFFSRLAPSDFSLQQKAALCSRRNKQASSFIFAAIKIAHSHFNLIPCAEIILIIILLFDEQRSTQELRAICFALV